MAELSNISTWAVKELTPARFRTKPWNPLEDVPWSRTGSLSPTLQSEALEIAVTGVSSEQTGQLVAARLLQEYSDLDLRTCLADQTSDEARHAEVLARYVIGHGRTVQPAPEAVSFQASLEAIEDPRLLLLAHTFLEGWAVDVFSLFVRAFNGDDALSSIYRLIRRDEARHVRNGVALCSRLVGGPSQKDAAELCRGAAEIAAEASGQGPEMWSYVTQIAGVDQADWVRRLQSHHEQRIQVICCSERR